MLNTIQHRPTRLPYRTVCLDLLETNSGFCCVHVETTAIIITAIVVAGLVFLALIVCVSVVVWRRYRYVFVSACSVTVIIARFAYARLLFDATSTFHALETSMG